MRVTISNKIYIEEPTEEIIKYCKDNLILANPDYFKKERMGKWTGNTPRYIWLYEQIGNNVILPFGCLKTVWNYINEHNVPYKADFSPLKRISYDSNIKLYSYQEKAVESVFRAKNGILVMPCGSGKTQTALQVISEIGGRCLWLTHTQDLLNQSYNRAKSVFGISAKNFGKITAGKVDIGYAITFATIQTMCKLDLMPYKNVWDIIIVDECQHCCGSPTRVTQFYKVLSNLSARYKIGLTATPKRADGLEKSMFALLGGVIYEVTREDVKDTTCPVRVISWDTNYQPDFDNVLMGDGTINYARLVDDLIHDEDRFKFVLKTIEQLPVNQPVLVLANRIEYLQKLNKHYFGRSNFLSATGNSKSAKEERKRALQALNDGDIDCLFASYQLAKEGLDIPNLRFVVFATPEKDPTTIEQSAGRVGRKSDGKTYGTVIDFVDEFGMYKGWWKKRLSVYKKIGCGIIE